MRNQKIKLIKRVPLLLSSRNEWTAPHRKGGREGKDRESSFPVFGPFERTEKDPLSADDILTGGDPRTPPFPVRKLPWRRNLREAK